MHNHIWQVTCYPERQRQELERQRRIEEERRKEIETMAALWMKSRNLRSFLKDCESSLSVSGKVADA